MAVALVAESMVVTLHMLMLKPGIPGSAAYADPPAMAGAGNGSTGALGTDHITSLVYQMPPVEALMMVTTNEGWLWPLFRT